VNPYQKPAQRMQIGLKFQARKASLWSDQNRRLSLSPKLLHPDAHAAKPRGSGIRGCCISEIIFRFVLFSYGSPPIAVYWILVQHIQNRGSSVLKFSVKNGWCRTESKTPSHGGAGCPYPCHTVERATGRNSKLAAAPRVALKMGRAASLLVSNRHPRPPVKVRVSFTDVVGEFRARTPGL